MKRTPGERLRASRRALQRRLAEARQQRWGRGVNVATRVNAVMVGNVDQPASAQAATVAQRVGIRQTGEPG